MKAHTDHGDERQEPRESRGSSPRLPAVGWLLSPRGVQFELWLLVFFSAIWLLAALALFGLLPLYGVLDLDLYRFYSLGAVLGWVSGNVYLLRKRTLPQGVGWKKRLLLAYLLGPPGILYLLRSLAPLQVQDAAPFVPLYSFAVYAIFFLVPVTLRPPSLRRPFK